MRHFEGVPAHKTPDFGRASSSFARSSAGSQSFQTVSDNDSINLRFTKRKRLVQCLSARVVEQRTSQAAMRQVSLDVWGGRVFGRQNGRQIMGLWVPFCGCPRCPLGVGKGRCSD
jgi:hypothetical protein